MIYFLQLKLETQEAWLAQSVEHLTLNHYKVNQKVAGSSPASGFLFYLLRKQLCKYGHFSLLLARSNQNLDF